ncbi:MAG: phosphotransferase [Rhodococcus sp. (in: high G+C Gram-positive bacteria)]
MPETAADYEPFARAALVAYNLEGAALTLLSFSENATYLAQRGVEQAVFRVHRPDYNSLVEIESELSWMASVRAESTVRTPQVRLAADGRSVSAIEIDGATRFVDVFEFVPGISAENEHSGIRYRDLGAITAALHQHVQQWTPPKTFRRFRWDLDTMLGEGGRWGNWRHAPNLSAVDRDVIESAEELVRRRLEQYGTEPGRYGLVHSDLRMSNLIVQDGDIVVIDFDDCGWSWYLTDLAAVITWNEAHAESQAIVEDWLHGYISVSPLLPEDIAEIPTFVMLRRLMITAWISTHPESVPAQTLGGHLASETASLARRYLSDPGWFAFDLGSTAVVPGLERTDV